MMENFPVRASLAHTGKELTPRLLRCIAVFMKAPSPTAADPFQAPPPPCRISSFIRLLFSVKLQCENDFECFASTGVKTPRTMLPNWIGPAPYGHLRPPCALSPEEENSIPTPQPCPFPGTTTKTRRGHMLLRRGVHNPRRRASDVQAE